MVFDLESKVLELKQGDIGRKLERFWLDVLDALDRADQYISSCSSSEMSPYHGFKGDTNTHTYMLSSQAEFIVDPHHRTSSQHHT